VEIDYGDLIDNHCRYEQRRVIVKFGSDFQNQVDERNMVVTFLHEMVKNPTFLCRYFNYSCGYFDFNWSFH
jgi:hypothetical protein